MPVSSELLEKGVSTPTRARNKRQVKLKSLPRHQGGPWQTLAEKEKGNEKGKNLQSASLLRVGGTALNSASPHCKREANGAKWTAPSDARKIGPG